MTPLAVAERRFWPLFQTACWAKGKVNEKLFYYSISVAIYHRDDTTDILLPPAYEVYPFLFVKSDVIQMAEKYRMKGKAAVTVL
jgi:hypothetical protein